MRLLRNPVLDRFYIITCMLSIRPHGTLTTAPYRHLGSSSSCNTATSFCSCAPSPPPLLHGCACGLYVGLCTELDIDLDRFLGWRRYVLALAVLACWVSFLHVLTVGWGFSCRAMYDVMYFRMLLDLPVVGTCRLARMFQDVSYFRSTES